MLGLDPLSGLPISSVSGGANSGAIAQRLGGLNQVLIATETFTAMAAQRLSGLRQSASGRVGTAWSITSTAGIVFSQTSSIWPGGVPFIPPAEPRTWSPSSSAPITLGSVSRLGGPRVLAITSSSAITVGSTSVIYPGGAPFVPPVGPRIWTPSSTSPVVIGSVSRLGGPRALSITSSSIITFGSTSAIYPGGSAQLPPVQKTWTPASTSFITLGSVSRLGGPRALHLISSAGVVFSQVSSLWPGGVPYVPPPLPRTWTPTSTAPIALGSVSRLEGPHVLALVSSTTITLGSAAVIYPDGVPYTPPPEPRIWQPSSSSTVTLTSVSRLEGPHVLALTSSTTITVTPGATPWR